MQKNKANTWRLVKFHVTDYRADKHSIQLVLVAVCQAHTLKLGALPSWPLDHVCTFTNNNSVVSVLNTIV